MTEVSFGVFDWIDRGNAPLNQLYEDRLCLLEEADRAGFLGYHLAEHHFTPLGMAPSPALVLSAAAQRTRNIRLGPLGYLLPIYNPLRLIEEVCMLDNLSDGRLDLGIGRGVSPYELGYYGVDSEESRSMMAEALAVLVEGMTHDRLTYHGQYFDYDDVPMELSPRQLPYPPIWYPTHNPESVVHAAEQGFNIVTLGPAAMARNLVDSYWSTWAEHRDREDRLNGHVTDPKVGIMRQVFVADTDAAALEAARSAHEDWFHSITKLWHAHGGHFPDALFNWDTTEEHETIIHGSPDRVKEQMGSMLETSGCNYVICSFAWGTFSQEQKLRSLRLFSQEVMPEFAAPS